LSENKQHRGEVIARVERLLARDPFDDGAFVV
jgi:hypothetical protein